MSGRLPGRRVVWTLLAALYAALVVASNLVMPVGDPESLPPEKRSGVRVPVMTDAGPAEPPARALIHTLDWNPAGER
ncbi:MAG: hypothetical protein ACIARR_01000, partial [Phycisphaerales bacterium JB059]